MSEVGRGKPTGWPEKQELVSWVVLVIVSVLKSQAICLQVKGLIVCKVVNPKDTILVEIGIRA